ncbi:MAG: aminoglycoside phosphotransferase-like protein [Acidimicrobiales bacterium]|nr:aminoglycoside phosphotransferase-like protein [Acidimicrobiales bacterium]
MTVSNRDRGEVRTRLAEWLAGQLGPGSAPEVSELTAPEANGMSSETLLFDISWDDAGTRRTRSCVARLEPQSTAVPVFATYDLDTQFEVMRLVGQSSSVPVPETLWFEHDPAVLGSPFFVMARIDGVVPPDVLPYTFGDCWLYDAAPEDQALVQREAVGILAGIHGIERPAADLAFLELDRPEPTALGRHVGHWRDYHEWVIEGAPSPLLHRAFAWLDEHWPAEEGPTAISWGDARIGNVLWHDFRPVGVLDWEMAGLAPREVDLAWMVFLHRFLDDIARQMGLTGMPEFMALDDVVAAYAERTGYEPRDMGWYLTYAAVRHGIVMRRVTERQIAFGEAERPADPDDLIMHRATIEAMLDGTFQA